MEGTDADLDGLPLRNRSNHMARDDKTLRAGFTGSPVDKQEGFKGRAKSAAALVKSEAGAVSAVAADHPHTTSTLLIGITALAFGLGYVLGRSAGIDRTPRSWR
jgi:hypothetical protein